MGLATREGDIPLSKMPAVVASCSIVSRVSREPVRYAIEDTGPQAARKRTRALFDLMTKVHIVWSADPDVICRRDHEQSATVG